MSFKDEVKNRRRALGMTQLELAYALKITPTTVSKWERGAAKPKFEILADLARVLGITEQELVRSDENDDEK